MKENISRCWNLAVPATASILLDVQEFDFLRFCVWVCEKEKPREKEREREIKDERGNLLTSTVIELLIRNRPSLIPALLLYHCLY